MGDGAYGHDLETIQRICREIASVQALGVELCLVVGGGNIFRGMAAAEAGMERATGDYMGMLATVMNALALQAALEQIDVDTRVMSAIPMDSVCEPYIRRRALRHMQKGRVVICAAGTGNPFFTTDTCAALRAVELNCDALFKGTQVDGIYNEDPKKNPDATFYPTLSYKKVLEEDLRVMDGAAIALARENKLPIVVFNMHHHGHFKEVISNNGKATIVE